MSRLPSDQDLPRHPGRPWRGYRQVHGFLISDRRLIPGRPGSPQSIAATRLRVLDVLHRLGVSPIASSTTVRSHGIGQGEGPLGYTVWVLFPPRYVQVDDLPVEPVLRLDGDWWGRDFGPFQPAPGPSSRLWTAVDGRPRAFDPDGDFAPDDPATWLRFQPLTRPRAVRLRVPVAAAVGAPSLSPSAKARAAAAQDGLRGAFVDIPGAAPETTIWDPGDPGGDPTAGSWSWGAAWNGLRENLRSLARSVSRSSRARVSKSRVSKVMDPKSKVSGRGKARSRGRSALLPVGSWLAALRSLFRRAPSEDASSASVPRRPKERKPPEPPGVPGVPMWLQLVARLSMSKRSRHLGRLLGHLARQDDDEVLRHAVPLTRREQLRASGGLGLLGGLLGALGAFGPRTNFRIQGQARVTTAFMDGSLFNNLQASYEELAQRLEHRGDLEKAAFVYAELMDQPSRAVDLFERHGLLRRAAEVAELCALDPVMIVRLWLLEGDLERALDAAKLFRAFKLALKHLESSNDPRFVEAARDLRRLWAEHAADGGDPSRAVAILWARPDLRPETRPWIRRATAAGPVDAAAMLSYRAQLDLDLDLGIASAEPREAPDRLLAEARRLLRASGGPSGRLDLCRRAYLDTVVETRPEPGSLAAALHRQVLPWLLPSVDEHDPAWTRRLAESVRCAGDKTFELEAKQLLRHLPTPRRAGKAHQESIHLRSTASFDPVFDATFVDGDRVLLAEGERGARFLDRHGRDADLIVEPVHRFVPAPRGRLMLGAARRDESWRFSKLDLVAGRGRRWIDIAADAFAPTFDGSKLWLARGQTLYAVDVTSDTYRALWHLPGLDGPVLDIRFADEGSKPGLYVLVSSPMRVWCLDARHVLRHKWDVETLKGLGLDEHAPLSAPRLDSLGNVVLGLAVLGAAGGSGAVLKVASKESVFAGRPLDSVPSRVGWIGHWPAALSVLGDGTYQETVTYRIHATDLTGFPQLDITIEGGGLPDWRFVPAAGGRPPRLVIWNKAGAVWAFDVSTRQKIFERS